MGLKGFQKGNVWTKLKIGMKYQPTLDKEYRREIFDQEVTQVWKEVIRKLPAPYIADQFIGKAPERIDHKVNFLFDEESKEKPKEKKKPKYTEDDYANL